MPWCPQCDTFLSPPTINTDGTCPRCGRAVDPGRAHTATDPAPAAGAVDDDELGPIPWHLKLLAGALVVYLGYRAWQGIEWLGHLL